MSSMASTSEGALSFSVAEVVEDVLQQHGSRVRGLDLESRKAEEAGIFCFLFFVSCFIFSASNQGKNSKFVLVMVNEWERVIDGGCFVLVTDSVEEERSGGVAEEDGGSSGGEGFTGRAFGGGVQAGIEKWDHSLQCAQRGSLWSCAQG
jgi:hypothetical protein